MRFSLRLNNDLPVSAYIELAQQAEKLGFDQIWVSSDLFYRSAPVILSAMALNTHRIHIGAGVLNPYTMHPAEIAAIAATLDEVSHGRFMLGLASGAAEFLGWVGMKHSKPLAELRQAVQTIRLLLRGERPADWDASPHWSKEAYLRFSPQRTASKRRIPIYIGAMGHRMLALAGEIGDGVLPLLFPPERYYTARRHVGAGLARRAVGVDANADAKDFDFATCIWASASQDYHAARSVLAHKIAYYGGAMNDDLLADMGVPKSDFEPITHALLVKRNEAEAIALVTDDMLRIGVVGSATDIIERLEPLAADGAAHLSFGPPLGPDLKEAARILAEVAAHFRRRA